MGIPTFFRWLKSKKYSDALTSRMPSSPKGLLIDMNAILHLACSITFLYGDFEDERAFYSIKNVDRNTLWTYSYALAMNIVESIVKFVGPTEILVISIDGVPPMGKVQQSSQRRYKNGLTINENTRFDTTWISPGTDYMFGFDNYFRHLINDFYKSFKVRRILYSPHTVPGEGEHKIMEYFRNGTIKPNDGEYVIYGNDADLILLSMLSPVEDLTLAKDSIPLYVKRFDRTSVDAQNRRGSKDNRNINIRNLRRTIIEEMGTSTSIEDFCFIMSLIGNDFLPHPASMYDIDTVVPKMMELYRTLGLNMTNRNFEVEWSNFSTFMANMFEVEKDQVKNLAKIGMKKPYKAIQDSLGDNLEVDYDRFRLSWYGDADQDQVNMMSLQFLIGMNWIFKYYTKGSNAVTWRWFYPFYKAPMLFDIAKLMQDQVDILPQIGSLINPLEGEKRMSWPHMMVSVMPVQSINVVHPALRYLYEVGSPILDLMPTNFEVEDEGAKVEWQGVAIKPFVDQDRVMAVVPESYIPPVEKDVIYEISKRDYERVFRR